MTLYRSTIDGSPLDPPQPPHIQPPFYAGLVVNTFVGATGASSLVELAVNDTDVTGYAAYEDGRLVRAVFVNLHAWLSDSTGARPSVHIDFDFAADTSADADAFWEKAATARRLIIDHADDIANLTLAGQSYEQTADVSPTGNLVEEQIALHRGLDLRATEAVLLEF